MLAVLLALLGPAIPAEEIPDSELNPQSGYIESVGTVEVGGALDVRHVVDPGQGGPKVAQVLSSAVSDDRSPRISIGTGGDTWVVWWRDGAVDEILARQREYSSGTWSAESVISSPDEESRNPAIALDAGSVWVVFEIITSSGVDIGIVASAVDDPWPFPERSILASTAFTGDVDVEIHTGSGELWASWVDSHTEVGWRDYDHASECWAPTRYESYATDSVEAARERIRSTLTGG
jgi:hypothetical protein